MKPGVSKFINYLLYSQPCSIIPYIVDNKVKVLSPPNFIIFSLLRIIYIIHKKGLCADLESRLDIFGIFEHYLFVCIRYSYYIYWILYSTSSSWISIQWRRRSKRRAGPIIKTSLWFKQRLPALARNYIRILLLKLLRILDIWKLLEIKGGNLMFK